MKGRDLRRIEADLAARRAPTVEHAAARAYRGRALVDAALQAARTGDPAPVPDTSPPAAAAPEPAVRYEYVACPTPGCRRPVWGLPGALCPRCSTPPQRLDDLVGGPPDPG